MDKYFKNLLLKRINPTSDALHTSGDSDRGGFHRTRREFLKVGGVSIAALASPTFLHSRPQITDNGTVLTVSYGGASWLIDRRLFAKHAKLRWVKDDDRFVVSLKKAFLPGTTFPVSFEAVLFRAQREWSICFSMPHIGFKASSELYHWLANRSSLRSSASIQDIRVADSIMEFRGQRVDLEVHPSFAYSCAADEIRVRIGTCGQCSGTSVRLSPALEPSADLRDLYPQYGFEACTSFLLSDPVANEPFVLNRKKLSRPLAFKVESFRNCGGEVCEIDNVRGGILIFEGPGLLGTFPQPDTARGSSGLIHLEQAALIVSSLSQKRKVALAGNISETPQRLDLGPWSASISGKRDIPFYASFSEENERATIDANLHGLSLPIEDGDLAHISTEQPVRLVFGSHSKGRSVPPAPKKPESGSIIVTGGRATAIDALVNLDETKLSIKRAIDCFNLSFEFVNFDLRVRNGVPLLRRRRSRTRGEVFAPAHLVVTFPPQHIAEQYFPFQDPTTLPSDAPLPANDEFAARKEVTRARLSGESRLVFKPTDKRGSRPKWVERPLTIDALTDWADLTLCVSPRALAAGSSLEKQLSIPKITCDTSLEKLAEQVAAQLKAPSPFETALELTGRLILSPSDEARWVVPRLQTNEKETVLWHARLDDKSRHNVRAVWSNWLTPGQFPSNTCAASGDELLVLTPSDHWELVAQTSLYGLAAIRNLSEPDKSQQTDGLPPNNGARKTSNRVIPPDDSFRALKELASDRASLDSKTGKPTLTVKDLGFAIVEPFDDANIILTAMGGSLGAEWNGEPFTIPPSSVGLPNTFNLERFTYHSQLGRDIHVETYRKGYLLPLGVRASYVTLSERRFAPHPRYGFPVCYLVKRTFIVIRKPEKRYPAVKQPYASRDFPVSRLVMLTRVTPDLISPISALSDHPCPGPSGVPSTKDSSVDPMTGRLDFNDLGLKADQFTADDLVFWPRVKRGKPGTDDGDVEFRWSIDDDRTPITSKLLFVSNSVARNAPIMAAVTNYYRGRSKNWDNLTTARLFGTRHRYAVPTSSTETSFDTDSWLLSMRGIAGESGAGESFASDSTLVLADQPPVFPVMQRARISVQALDHLMGTPQGLIEVRYFSQYISSGFPSDDVTRTPDQNAAQVNPGQIFLEVLSPAISLNANNNGGATGGLARPNATLAALSRTTGIVGGQDINVPGTTYSGSGISDASLIGNGSVEARRFDFGSASTGKFDPKEFFSDDAKLLGLIPFKALLQDIYPMESAPTLLEKVEYGGGTANAVGIALMSLCQKLRGKEDDLNKQLSSLLGSVTIRQLYPSLDTSLTDFCKTAEQVGQPNAIEYASAVAYKGRDLLRQMQHIIDDPLPTLAQQELETLKGAWEQLQSAPLSWANEYSSRLVRPFEELLSELVASFGDAGLKLRQQLIALPSPSDLDLHNADKWLVKAREAVLGPLLGIPLASAYDKLNSLQLTIAGPTQHSSNPGQLVSESIPLVNNALAAALQFTDAVVGGSLLHLWNSGSKGEAAPAATFLQRIVLDLPTPIPSSEISSPARSPQELTTYAQALISACKDLSAERPDLVEKLAAARTNFISGCEVLKQQLSSLTDGLEAFQQATATFAQHALDRPFASKSTLLNSAANVISQRRAAMHALQNVAQLLPGLDVIATSECPTPSCDPLPKAVAGVRAIAKQVADLLLVVGNLNEVGSESESWKATVDLIRRMSEALSSVPAFHNCMGYTDPKYESLKDCLDQITQDYAAEAEKLRKQLTPDAQHRVALAAIDVDNFTNFFNKQQPLLYALTLPVILSPLTEATTALQATLAHWKKIIGVISDLHKTVAAALGVLVQQLKLPLVSALLDPTVPSAIQQIVEDLKKDADTLSALETELAKLDYSSQLNSLQHDLQNTEDKDKIDTLYNGIADIASKLRSGTRRIQQTALENASSAALLGLGTANAPPTITRAWSIIQDVVGPSLQRKLGTVLTREALTTILQSMADSLQQTLLQLLPTGTDTGYDWSTELKPFKSAVFCFSGQKGNCDDSETVGLTLSSRVKVRYFDAPHLDANTTGKLGPFTLTILRLVDLKFKGADFVAGPGGSPKLNVVFDKVVILDGLNFLKALQSFMSPKEGSGPYVVVNADFVRAGYRFDASVLQVGSLQFIHVSLNVFAHIPLRGLSDGDLSAQLGFGFGTEERPFLIAQPPYGGGGFVELTFKGGKLVPKISLSFGAVVAIHFGPLDGHGRVTSTITWGNDLIKATVEAIGEGHIGCFGIAVMLQIGLIDKGGDLTGSATYSFEFSVGHLLTVSFHVTAHYKIHGGEHSSDKESAAVQSGGPNRYYLADYATPALRSVGLGEQLLPVGAAVSHAGEAQRKKDKLCTSDHARRRIALLAPSKLRAWGKYRGRLAMELL